MGQTEKRDGKGSDKGTGVARNRRGKPVRFALPGDTTYANHREANRALRSQGILPLARKLLDVLDEGSRLASPSRCHTSSVNSPIRHHIRCIG